MQAHAPSAITAEQFATPRGELALWYPSPSLFLCRVRRHGDREFAAPFMRAFDALRSDRVHIFLDFDQMATYDSDLRVSLTNFFSEQRARIEQIDLMTSSKLVRMGAELTRLTLGTFFRSHARREPFTSVLDAAIAARGLQDFTSAVLRT